MRIAILLVIIATMAGLTYGAFTAFLTRRAIDTARRENEALRARHAALREDAFELGARAAEELERGRRMTRSAGLDRGWQVRSLRTPSKSAGDESIIAWLSGNGAQLESLAVELSAGDATVGAKQAAVSAPKSTGAVSANGAEVPQLEASRSVPAHSAGKAAG